MDTFWIIVLVILFILGNVLLPALHSTNVIKGSVTSTKMTILVTLILIVIFIFSYLLPSDDTSNLIKNMCIVGSLVVAFTNSLSQLATSNRQPMVINKLTDLLPFNLPF